MLTRVFSLEDVPYADRLLTTETITKPEPRSTLDLRVCPNCLLLQLSDAPKPEDLFGESYVYLSGAATTLRRHYGQLADRLVKAMSETSGIVVLDVAANDGTLLSVFRKHGASVLGIEPAPIPAKIARDRGIAIVEEFFDEALAQRLATDGRQADIVVANNVLAHVPDPTKFLRGLARVLKPEGILSIEVAWVGDMIERLAFDTVYHQHRCYFSLASLEPLIAQSGLNLRQIEVIPLQGASLRLTLGHGGLADDSVESCRKAEAERRLDRIETYVRFGESTARTAAEIGDFVRRLKSDGARIAAYGAAAKGSTLLHAAHLGPLEIDYVVDKNAEKIGRFMPGNRVPIKSATYLREDCPDFVLLLAWNYADEVLAQEATYIQRGGKFILPIPTPQIMP